MVKIRTRKDLNVGNVMRKIRNNAIKLENKSRVKLVKENVHNYIVLNLGAKSLF